MRGNKKKRSPSRGPSSLIPVGLTQTEAGVGWLSELDEAEFRDRVLVELFRQMQRAGALQEFEKVHGRNDKGVDFLLARDGEFGRVVLGIQAKSRGMTRSDSAGALSAVRVCQECYAAMHHAFPFKGHTVRLDNIAVWSSAHLTEDAERELNPAHGQFKIQVLKPRELLGLLEKYCPQLLSKVPLMALSSYLDERKNPKATAFRLLGCQLNPRTHFLEPTFTSAPPASLESLTVRRGVMAFRDERFSIDTMLSSDKHCLILAPSLSGRTYLLRHLECRFAQLGRIPVLIPPDSCVTRPTSIENLMSKQLGFLSPKQVGELANSAQFALLVDDIDKVSAEWREFYFGLDPQRYRVVSTAKSVTAPTHVFTLHLAGVSGKSVVRFLRSLDRPEVSERSFLDRAESYLGRSLDCSGLPRTPFVISIMLAECHSTSHRFSTPTMGRLIERFIELQLGSHSDVSFAVDFETRREFLTRLAGHPAKTIRYRTLRHRLAKFIEAKGHPHLIDDFLTDLANSGVLVFSQNEVSWAHDVLHRFFWVKNLLAKNRFGPILKRLQLVIDETLAALVGSQMRNSGPIAEGLLSTLSDIRLPTSQEVLQEVGIVGSLAQMISDQQEEELLHYMERTESSSEGNVGQSNRPEAGGPDRSGGESVRPHSQTMRAVEARLDRLMVEVAESKCHVAFNLAALLLNSRDTGMNDKVQIVKNVIYTNQRLGNLMQQSMISYLEGKENAAFLTESFSLFLQMSLNDRMLGDPHLVHVFRRTLKSVERSDQEMLFLLDLLLRCGEANHDEILKALKKANNLAITLALYCRTAALYFMRFHRPGDRTALRQLLKDIRKQERSLDLPRVRAQGSGAIRHS